MRFEPIGSTKYCVAITAVAMPLGLLVVCQGQPPREGGRALWTPVAMDISIMMLEAFGRCQSFVAVLAKAVLRGLFMFRCRQLGGKGRAANVAGEKPRHLGETNFGTGICELCPNYF